MSRLSVSPVKNKDNGSILGTNYASEMSMTIVETGEKCCNLCNITEPDICWRKDTINYLINDSRVVLCMNQESLTGS